MGEPAWIELDAILALHERTIALHGGAARVRDRGLLESALARAPNRYNYEGTADLAALAATYAVAVSSNHPFADGNKRAAFLCMALFLRLNGLRLKASQVDAARTMYALAADEIGVEALTDWMRRNCA